MLFAKVEKDLSNNPKILVSNSIGPPCAGTGCSVEEHYRWGLEQGYSGTWDWSMIGGDGNDDGALCAAGMAALAGEAKVRAVQLGAEGEAEDTCRGVGGTSTQ